MEGQKMEGGASKEEIIEQAQALIKYLEDKILNEERMAEILESPLDHNSSSQEKTEDNRKAAQLRRDMANVYRSEIKRQKEIIESHQAN